VKYIAFNLKGERNAIFQGRKVFENDGSWYDYHCIVTSEVDLPDETILNAYSMVNYFLNNFEFDLSFNRHFKEQLTEENFVKTFDMVSYAAYVIMCILDNKLKWSVSPEANQYLLENLSHYDTHFEAFRQMVIKELKT
ncbi:MAG: hypothetical protein LUB61_00645, partial [Eggerthellaceae bacterium]|nr:hypothetical protein [Eggerthellaceae bacterium]